MFKQLHQKFGYVLLFLLILLALMVPIASAAGVEGEYYNITVNYTSDSDSAMGSFAVSGNSPNEAGQYLYGSKVTLKALPENGYQFVGWYNSAGIQVNPEIEYTIVVEDHAAYTAKFAPRVFNITYKEVTGVDLKGQVSTHTYGTGTVIPDPEKTGYDFIGWIIEGKTTEPRKNLTIGGQDYDTDIVLIPKFSPQQFPVTREDYILETGAALGSITWDAEMDSYVDGRYGLGEHDPVYPGYHFDSTVAGSYIENELQVTISAKNNIVKRYYVPNVYTIEYLLNNGTMSGNPTTHTYSKDTPIYNPVRTGYVFKGWNVNGTFVSVNVLTGESLTLGGMDHLDNITLEAVWEAADYTIDYNLNGGTIRDNPAVHTYDKETTIPNPTRLGYTFTGWLVDGILKPVNLEAGEKLVLGATDYLNTVHLVAQWQANTYQVTLDGDGATTAGTETITAVFDADMPVEGLVLPQRIGYTFCGFYSGKSGSGTKYINADGTSARTWDEAEDVTLYAYWTVNQYMVTVKVENAEVIVNGTLYTGPMSFDYKTPITIEIKAISTHKVVKWAGNSIDEHQQNFTYTFEMGAEDVVLEAVTLPIVTVPAFKVDYVKEHITVDGGIPAGTYRIVGGGTTLDVVVSENGDISVKVNGKSTSGTFIPLHETFFDNTIQIVAFGEKDRYANSDPLEITVAERPAAPLLNDEIVNIYTDNTSAVVQMKNDGSLKYVYEFAISVNENDMDLKWKSAEELASPNAGAVMFENLNPGTIYYVYVRVKALDGNYAHGKVSMFRHTTHFENYLNKKISELQALIEENDGEMVKALIAQAIEDAKALAKPSATFYNDLEGIYNRAVSEVPFARQQDTRIAELRALRDSLIATKEFSTEGENTLNAICDTAVSTIAAAKTEDEIENVYSQAVKDMKAVKVTHLAYGDMGLTSFAGLPQGTRLFLQRIADLTALTNSVNVAIQAEKIAMDGDSMSYAEAIEAMKTLDLMAAYTMKLSNGESVFADYAENEVFEMRLLLPEDLRTITGLQVACYNEKTGMLEVLDTERVDNYLVFTTTHIGDFVILGDPTMDLTGFIIALGLIVACQLIGIILLLVRRGKHARELRHYSFGFVPAVLLTIRFLPDNAFVIAIVLAVLMILLQIILMYLLFSSEMFHLHRRRRDSEYASEDRGTEYAPRESVYAAPASVSQQEKTASDDDQDDTDNDEPTAETVAVFVDLDDEEETEEYTEEEEEVSEDAEEYEEVEEASYDFIEPAANPRYSLPEDESPAYSQDSVEDPEEDGEEEFRSAEEESDGTWDYDDPSEENSEETIADADGTSWQQSVPVAEWQYDDEEIDDAPYTAGVEELSEEVVEEDDDPFVDPSVRGEPAEDQEPESPVTGAPYDEEEAYKNNRDYEA